MTDLQSLFDKLDEALGEQPWALRHCQGRIGRVWRVETRQAASDVVAENASPELAIRAVLGALLERVQGKGRDTEEQARIARDEAARLRSIIERQGA